MTGQRNADSQTSNLGSGFKVPITSKRGPTQTGYPEKIGERAGLRSAEWNSRDHDEKDDQAL